MNNIDLLARLQKGHSGEPGKVLGLVGFAPATGTVILNSELSNSDLLAILAEVTVLLQQDINKGKAFSLLN